MPNTPTSALPRCEARREQILDAAAVCFAREGFHGSSIAKLSKEAGMSPGHIYHFFENKEAIIAALIERRLECAQEMARHFDSTEDVFQALLDRVDIGLKEKTDRESAALELEIFAEAARNPAVASILIEADRIKRDCLIRVTQKARQARTSGQETRDPKTQTESMVAETEILMALFDGLSTRAISHPELDREALTPLLRKVMRALL
ncbi:regulatory protein TetR [Thiorhodococcus drewsii AZ1]|uniref:Regulatory protein TetR n=1 Tax=Thiorhodococcus drewsii AZ1 TaxID=765913 RepID=G2E1P3_9GAMM|nr:TetR/AcrR family transcriptional regulator [Thiorhodococcus drewsii]EGV31101.1 regulatory protein TetR [Thiorhodococcus drewsii AZ1]